MNKKIYRIDWLKKSKQDRHKNANKTMKYLNETGARERFGFGTGASTQPIAPLFERDAILPGLLSGNLSQVDWFDVVLTPAFNNYNAAYDAWQDPVERTQAKILTLRTAENIFIPLYRQLYALVKQHPAVTDTDLAEMMFPVPQHTHTPAPVPTSHPEASVSHPSSDVVEISFRDSESKKTGKPAGVHGAEIAWAILDTAPRYDEWDKLTHSSFDTASPFTLSFTGSGGKNLYFALRWENTRGEKGPWSDIQHTVIS